tara:strand:+ start:166 stop:1008 length:843 start_codon:yes stop_codon:yes gene_type:complete
MLKVQATSVEVNASTSYKLLRSNVTYSAIKSSVSFSKFAAAEVILDYDTKNRYFRDESFTLGDLAALTPEKNVTDSVGTVSDVLQSVDVGKGPQDDFSIGDFAFVLLTLQRQFSDSLSIGDTSTLTAGINRDELLNAIDVVEYAYSKPVTDTATLSELIVTSFDLAKIDSVTTADVFSRTLTYSRAFADTLTLDDFTDINAFTKDTVGAKSNSVSFTDTQHFSTAKSVGDTPTMSDLYTSVFVTGRTDAVSVAESISVLNRSLAPSVLNAGALNTATLNN